MLHSVWQKYVQQGHSDNIIKKANKLSVPLYPLPTLVAPSLQTKWWFLHLNITKTMEHKEAVC